MSPAAVQTIVKMLGLLGSEHDGEVLAAVRAIKRKLATERATFGDLLQALGGKSTPHVVVMYARPTKQQMQNYFEQEMAVRRATNAARHAQKQTEAEKIRAAKAAMNF